MANVAVIGAQWGDEGKGKVVDWLASRADIVVRFQGGHNGCGWYPPPADCAGDRGFGAFKQSDR